MTNNETQQLLPGVVKPDAGLRGPLRSWFPKTAAAVEQPTGQLADAKGSAGATVTQMSDLGPLGAAHSMAGDLYDKMGLTSDIRDSIYNSVAGPKQSGLGTALLGDFFGTNKPTVEAQAGKPAGTAVGNALGLSLSKSAPSGAMPPLSGSEKPAAPAPAPTRREDQAQIKPGTPVKAAPVAGFTPAARQAVNMPVLNPNAGGLFSAMAGFQGDAAAAGSAIANNRMAKTMDEIGLRNAGRIDSYNQQNASRGEQGRQFGLGLQQKDRQFDIGTGEHRFQYDTTMGENKRQFDANLGLHQQQNQIAMAKAMMEQRRANEDQFRKQISSMVPQIKGPDGKMVDDVNKTRDWEAQALAKHPEMFTASPEVRNKYMTSLRAQIEASDVLQNPEQLNLFGKAMTYVPFGRALWGINEPGKTARSPTVAGVGASFRDWATNPQVSARGTNIKSNTGFFTNIKDGMVNQQPVSPEVLEEINKSGLAGGNNLGLNAALKR